jgi:hypothetical protein
VPLPEDNEATEACDHANSPWAFERRLQRHSLRPPQVLLLRLRLDAIISMPDAVEQSSSRLLESRALSPINRPGSASMKPPTRTPSTSWTRPAKGLDWYGER